MKLVGRLHIMEFIQLFRYKMKTIITFILIFVSTVLYSADNATSYDFDSIVIKVERMMGISDSDIIIKYLPSKYGLGYNYGYDSEARYNIIEFDIVGLTIYYEKGDVYVIHIKKGLSKYEAMSSLVHEMVHVWQLYSGKIIRINDNTVLWQGWMEIKLKDNRIDSPWEREAEELTPLVIKKIKI